MEALNWWLGDDGALCVSQQELTPRRILGLLWGLTDGEDIGIIPKLSHYPHGRLQPNQGDPTISPRNPRVVNLRGTAAGRAAQENLPNFPAFHSPARCLQDVFTSPAFARSSQISYKTDVPFFFHSFIFFPLPFFLLVRKSLCSNCRQVGRCFLHNSPSYEMFMKHLPQISYASRAPEL